MSCEHQQPIVGAAIVTITPPTYQCIFCELERLRAELTQARLDLAHADALRGALVEQACEVARDMSRALSMVEAAFHAGWAAVHKHRSLGRHITVDEAYNEWTKGLAS